MKRISLAVILPIVLLILSSLAITQIPGLFPNERFVIRAARQIHGAQATYQATYGSGGYGTLTQLANAGFIDSALASGTKYGYSFAMTVVPYSPGIPSSFRLTATPVRYPKAGRRSFFIDQFGELHGADKNGEVANENDPYIDTCALFGIADNERCTLADMRTLHGAEATYQATTGIGNFGTLRQLGDANLIPQRLSTGLTHGYRFTVTITNYVPGQSGATMRVSAVPQIYGVTGIRSFFIATDGVLRGADRKGAPADENDPEIDMCAGTGPVGNEQCSISDMRTLHGAESTFQATSGNGNFGSLAQLGALGLISSNLASGATHGYTYVVTTVAMQPGQSSATFKVTAVPTTYGVTGIRSFFIATDGVLHGADHQGQPASENDPPIGQ